MSNIFYEGQQVGCLKNGVGTVVNCTIRGIFVAVEKLQNQNRQLV